LPETYFDYGVIKHYSESSLNYETKSFNLAKVIDGSEVIKLEAQDEIYIFSKNDIATTSYITTKGDVLIKSGKFRYFKGMTIKDAINASGVDGIIDDKVRVTTINTADRMPKTTFYSLKENGNIMLSLYDEVEVYDYYQTHMLEPVSIKGEVVNPITVFYENNMSLADLLEVAGGTTTKAYLDKIEIVRYYIDKERNRQSKIMNIDLLNTDKKEFKLQPYDEVTVYKIPKWGEKNTVTIKGEVRFPGTYTISNGEKLSSVIRRAGGYTDNAFVDGAVFTRESIRKNQIEQYNNALARVKRELAIFNAMPANSKKAASMSQASDTLNEVISEAQKYQPIGRVSIKLDEDLSKFEKSEYNLVLKDQDTLIIPSDIDTVTVFGEVFNPTSFVYSSNKSIEDYIELASGFSRSADKSNVYVIHADGTSEPIDSGWFSSGVEIKKGDTIVVPIYIKEYEMLSVWDSVARILSSFALTVASVKTLGVF
jgi:protein involved in polysaccharide export with SLBB domain